jgi:hypothetical protein
MNPITPYNFVKQVAFRVLDLLLARKAMLHPAGTVFYVWQRGNRIVVAFDPSAIELKRVNEDFAHELSTRLHGRLVVRTNSRGIFLQIGFEIPAAPQSLDTQPLDFGQQATPWHMPIGTTKDGPLWISLVEGDSFLVGGSRGGGKTGEVHGWIQALLHGDKTLIYASDGKRGLEFGAYANRAKFNFFLDSVAMLEALKTILLERETQLHKSGYPNIILHNEAGGDFIAPIALFVDEAADLPDQAKETLKSMIRLYRHLGLYPIIATNQPTVADVFAKTNLSTRVAFRVPHHNDSITMLGYKGAEALPDERGRGLIVWKGRFIEFQSFLVTYPTPTDETRRLVTAQIRDTEARPALVPVVDEISQLASSIQELWRPDMSKSEVSRLLGKNYTGTSWVRKVNQVVEKLSSTTPTPTQNRPDSDAIAA